MTDETPAVQPPDDDTLTCESCQALFAYSGRGRRPRKCPDCRTSRTPAAPGPADDTAPKRARGIDALEKNIATQLVMLGMAAAIVDPFDSQIIIMKAQKGAKALSNLAATNPKIKALLESSVESAGYLPVAVWALEMILPILAHHGVLPGVPDPAQVTRSGPVSPGTGPGAVFNLMDFHRTTGVPNGNL